MTVRQDLVRGNSQIGNALVTRAGRIASEAFLNLGSWRDDDIDRYLEIVAPTISGAKREAARSSVTFYKAIADLSNENFTSPVINASDIATQTLRNGTDTATLYRRPFVDMRTQLAKGKSLKESIEAGARRANSLASTEVQLARRNAGLKARNANDRIVGYIRTLTGAENCALCFVASTQRYTRGELMPIHPGCDCGEMPIFGTEDPGQVINEVNLEAVHENVATRFGFSDRGAREIDYRKIKVVDHGEMGPTLTVRANDFDGPDSLDLVGTTTTVPKDARNPDFYDVGLKTQLIDELETDPSIIKQKTNPKYKTTKGYTNNCTNCVTAYDMRRRGYDVVAKPFETGRPVSQILINGYENLDKSPITLSQVNELRKKNLTPSKLLRDIVDNNPDGSRGFVDARHKRVLSGHVWAWEKKDGKVQFFEPQSPDKVNTREYLKNFTDFAYVRTDNLNPKKTIVDFVEDA